MKNNLVIIGFMATGKTSVAQALASKLGKEYVSTDDLIVKKANKYIPKIFEDDGEIKFRELEIEIVKTVSEMDDIVVDCGGGVVLNWINVVRLKEKGIIVLLTASVERILERSSSSTERPLLNVQNTREKIVALLKFREPFYEKAADVIIDTNNLSIDNIVAQILDFLK
ncbi:shikimate kinase [Candidatus Borrarchaeum sp.]|uniref:shikimate kinase n=1 Tax=Candidatus Borrarchaeum sp. TaxID=2846742 RepID=UPI00257CD2BC|nr:shikimate kinase [Candidatus Borrarchaeum sp.]